MINIDKLVRDNVKALKPYSCARDEYQGNDGVFLDANENPFGTLNRYPDPYQKKLKAVISKIKNVPEEMIFLGNGSDEVIDLTYRIFCNPGTDKALTFPPTYGMYEVSAAINDVGMVKIPLDENFGINFNDVKPYLSDKNLKLIIICSPNNPTGNSMNRNTIEKIITSFNGIVLVDEAYNDFTGLPSLSASIEKYPNLIVMQTFSKAFGMASVRVGMAFSNTNIIRYFNKMKPPYNISTINQETVLKKLGKKDKIISQVKKIKKERENLLTGLKSISCITEVYPSDANFILVKVKDAGYIYNTLISNNIITRNRSSVINNCIRITVGTKEENKKLLKALKQL